MTSGVIRGDLRRSELRFSYINVAVGHDLPDNETTLAYETWKVHAGACYETMRVGRTEHGAPELPETLMGWMLFTQWAFDQYGVVPSGT